MREIILEGIAAFLLWFVALFLWVMVSCRGTQGDEIEWGERLYSFEAFTRDSIRMECRVHAGIRPAICNFLPDTTR